MFRFEVEPEIAAGVSEATLFTLIGTDAIGKMVIVENLDQANTLTYKWQWSNDQVTWTDIAAATTLSAGDSIGFLRTEVYQYLRLRGSGNLNVAVAVLRVQSFSGNFSHAVL